MKAGKIITHVTSNFAHYLKTEKLLEHLDELVYTVSSRNAKFFRLNTKGMITFKGLHDKMLEKVMVDAFLRTALPEYAHKSRKARENLVKSFEVQDFCQGVTLIKEGESMSTAFLIIEGEIKLLKKVNAVNADKNYGKARAVKPPRTNEVEQSKGSLTTKEASTYQLGIRAAKDWLCEEVLFLKERQPFQYTAIARLPTKVIKISKADMLHYLDPEYL